MDHYTHLASHYDEYYRYSEGYVTYFTNTIIEGASIKNNDIIVELGSGTGIFAKQILSKIPSVKMICVDNSLNMLEQNTHKHIKQVCQDAVAFSKESILYDKVYMKEFIHHISKENRLRLFDGLYSQLDDHGCLLILIEPRRLDYPLFNKALQHFEIKQPSHLELIKELELAGFKVSFTMATYEISLKKNKYIDMVRNRYMSVLEDFTDLELEEGLQEILALQKNDTLQFREVFYNIKGIK